ncbi:MAG: HAD-IA family hydrolase [Planctomycetota bacterium]
MSIPSLAVFDLGGVVVRICRTWQEACHSAGVVHNPNAEARLDSPRKVELLRAHQCGEVESGKYFDGLAQLLEDHSTDEVRRVHAAWILGDYSGMAQLMDRIHHAGMRTACLSNTNAHHWEQLDSSEAFRRIQVRHASHLMGLVKPDQRIYRAFEIATETTPQEIVFFDDLAENIEAARACGWNAVHIDHTSDTAAQVLAGLRAHGALA